MLFLRRDTSNCPTVVSRKRRDGGWNIYERSRKSTTKPKSLWIETDVINEQGTIEVGKLGIGNVFDHPKPVGLITKCLHITTRDEDIILDFFAGASTTAHAVLNVNRQDAGRRQFILVQLPEPTEEISETREQGYNTIADIGKERIRRVIKKLKDETKKQQGLFKDRATPEDLGFRVFKLAESNYRQWGGLEEKEGEAWAQEMELFTDPLAPGWKPENVIWEVALKEGYSLSSRVEKLKGIKGSRVWQVIDPDRERSFRICLDGRLPETTVTMLQPSKDELFICRDAAQTDEQAANLALQCRLKTI